jgi:hypothetical protein
MRRWTAAYRLRYRPVISFERRRSALLDWVEQNVEPVSFRDDRNEVGLSLSKGVRIRIGRQTTTLEDSIAADDGVESLWPMLDGLVATMEPRDILLTSASIAWSSDLAGWSYPEATRALAARVTGVASTLSSGLVPDDSAPLADFRSERLHVQAEWGVVTPPELRERLNDEELGKVEGRPKGVISVASLHGLPPTLMFVATAAYSRTAELIADANGIRQAINEFQNAGEEVADAVVTAALVEKEIAK